MHKTIWFKIHWILGITAGIVLFVVGVTGATLSFEKEITRFINQDSFYVTASTEPKLSAKELLEKFQANNPKAKINSISISTDPEDSVVLNEKFLDFLQNHYKIWYYAFNERNKFKSHLKTRKNFVLEPDNYENIRQKYSPKRKRKLRLNPGIVEFSEIKEKVSLSEAIKFIKINMIGAENKKDKVRFLEIIKTFSDYNLLDFYGFYFKDKLINLVAIYQENYTSVLIGTYNIKDLVKYNGASNLIDFAIRKNVETKKFDFEGGELSNMEEYFRGFRAEQRNYAVIENTKRQLIKKAIKFFS